MTVLAVDNGTGFSHLKDCNDPRMEKTLQVSSGLPHGKAGEKSCIFSHKIFLAWTGIKWCFSLKGI